MLINVDRDRCDSTGLCAELSPEVFELGSDDVLHLRTVNPDERYLAGAERAARACPKLAITLADSD